MVGIMADKVSLVSGANNAIWFRVLPFAWAQALHLPVSYLLVQLRKDHPFPKPLIEQSPELPNGWGPTVH